LVKVHGDPARQRPLDVTIYQSFFWQVSFSTGDTLYPAPPAEPIVLTERENQAVRTLAADCQSKLQFLRASIKSVRMELLFQTIEAGQPSEELKRQLGDLQVQESQIAQEHFQSLKAVFGDSRFQMVQEFLRGWDPDGGSPFANPASKPRTAPDRKK
jgi:hypothetical protein